jgi:hypothetical protein
MGLLVLLGLLLLFCQFLNSVNSDSDILGFIVCSNVLGEQPY